MAVGLAWLSHFNNLSPIWGDAQGECVRGQTFFRTDLVNTCDG